MVAATDKRPAKAARKPEGRGDSTPLFDRPPPFDIDAEINLLGSVMLLPDVLDSVVGIVSEGDFHDESHRKIFQRMLDMHATGRKIDTTLLVDRLKAAGDYEAVGGAAYLGKILHAVPNAAHAVYYAEIVKAKSLLRQTINTCTDALREAYEPQAEPIALLGRLESQALDIIAEGSRASESKAIDLSVHAVLEEIDRRCAGEKLPGILTGFASLDDVLSGFKPGQFIVIAGRPGMGKSAAALNIAMNVAMEGDPVYFSSMEMSAGELTERALCSMARVSSYDMQRGCLSAQDRQRIVEASGRLAGLPIEIADRSGQRLVQIAADVRRLKRKKGLSLAIIDYLQLIEPDNPRDHREQQVAKMARGMKVLARELEIPVVCLAQLNRQAEHAGKAGGRPSLGTLRESGAIEQDADVVIFTHRPDYYVDKPPPRQGESETAEFVVAKQRNGRQGICKVLWFGSYFSFANAAETRWEERRGESHENAGDFDNWNQGAA